MPAFEPIRSKVPGPERRRPASHQDWRLELLRVTYKGNQATVYFDHRKVFDAFDGGLTSAGRAGVWTKADTVAYFDDFRIDKRDSSQANESRVSRQNPVNLESLERAGGWFLESGIQEPNGGVARFYRADLGRNRAISTEITGYAASALMYLHSATGDPAYLARARHTAGVPGA